MITINITISTDLGSSIEIIVSFENNNNDNNNNFVTFTIKDQSYGLSLISQSEFFTSSVIIINIKY